LQEHLYGSPYFSIKKLKISIR